MRISLLALAAALLAGPATAADRYEAISVGADQLKGAPLAYAARGDRPEFLLMRPTNGAFAVLGVVAAMAASKSYWTDNHMADPAVALRESLVSALAAQYGMLAAPSIGVSDGDKVEQVAAKANGGRYVLDVRDRIGVTYEPLNWTHYRVSYAAAATLTDVQTRQVVARGACGALTPTDHASTYDELSANEAALLKQIVAASAADCEAHFRSEVFKLAAVDHSRPQAAASPPAAASVASTTPATSEVPPSSAVAQ